LLTHIAEIYPNTAWRWPSRLKHNGVCKVLIKRWYINIWVQVLVFIRYSDISARNKKDKVPILCFPSASWNTSALSLLQEKQNYLIVSYIWILMQLFLYKGPSHSSFIKELVNSDPQKCRKGHWLVTIRVHIFRGTFLFMHVIKHTWNEVLCLVHCKLQLLATSIHKQLHQLMLYFLTKAWKRERLLIFIMK